MGVGVRLKEERERLGFNQPVFAAIAGATKQTVNSWEAGRSSPKADQLEALGEQGVDVYYVLTGQRVGLATTLSAREFALVENYRAAPEAGKAALDTTSAYLAGGNPAPAPTPQKQTNFSIGSVHGSVVEGGVVNNGPTTFGNESNNKKK